MRLCFSPEVGPPVARLLLLKSVSEPVFLGSLIRGMARDRKRDRQRMDHSVFSGANSKKIVLVAHCILNQNSIVDGTAAFPGCIGPIIDLLSESGVGILQMPCPELICLGLAREYRGLEPPPLLQENTRIRQLMGQESARRTIQRLVRRLVYQVHEYVDYGFEIRGVIGINRSPSCGVDTTTEHNKETRGEGVFIRAFRDALEDSEIHVEMIGIRVSEPREAVDKIRKLLHG
jgi:predicted secreted protein